jgi:hypothetical protein
MALAKKKAGARPMASKTRTMVVFKKMKNKINSKMATTIMGKSREAENTLERRIAMVHMNKEDKKAKWDNMNNKTSIKIENLESLDSNLLLSRYESMNLEEEKKLSFEES